MRALAVAVVCAAAVLAGCAGPVARKPAGPSLAEVNSWGSDIGPNGEWPPDVPVSLKVREPKDARGVGPCDLLTPAQLRELGLVPATAHPDAEGYAQTCWWYNADESDSATVSISTDPRGSKLPSLYRVHHDQPAYRQFEVDGHPAVRSDSEPNRDCEFTVAAADLQTFVVHGTYIRTPRADPCKEARRMAEMVLSNLPPLR